MEVLLVEGVGLLDGDELYGVVEYEEVEWSVINYFIF